MRQKKSVGASGSPLIIPLRDIIGVHPKVQPVTHLYGDIAFQTEAGSSSIGVFSFDKQKYFSAIATYGLLTSHPIYVLKYRGKLYCTGGILTWKIACSSLSPNAMVSVIELPLRTSEDVLRSVLFFEVLFIPLIFGIDKPAILGNRMEAIARLDSSWLKNALPNCTGKRAFARLMGRARNSVFPNKTVH